MMYTVRLESPATLRLVEKSVIRISKNPFSRLEVK